MNVLDALLFGIRNVLFAGSAMPTRSAINVHGAGVTVTDDVANERTDIEIPGAGPGAGLTLTTVKTAYYEAAVGELVLVDASAGDITIVAPTNAAGHVDERWGVLRVETTLPVAHVVTINADDGVNDEGTRDLAIARSCCLMRSDGHTWRVESEFLDVTVSDATPQAVGTATAGTSQALARADHVHAVSYTTIQTVIAGATGALGVNSQRITSLADPIGAQDAATKAFVLANAGGAPARIVALDANDIAEWKLDDAAEPWADGVGSLSLTGYGGLGSYAPAVVTGGSIHNDRCVFCDWSVDTGLRSDTTTVGEVAAGTVHGWALLMREGGTLFSKDEGNSIYLHTYGSDPSLAYELTARVGDSGDVVVAPTRYRALVHSGAWTHFAMTWAGGTAYVYVNGVRLPTAISYSSITWGAGRWRLGVTAGLGSISALMSSWRLCNVARSAAYINEVYKRAVGLYP